MNSNVGDWGFKVSYWDFMVERRRFFVGNLVGQSKTLSQDKQMLGLTEVNAYTSYSCFEYNYSSPDEGM